MVTPTLLAVTMRDAAYPSSLEPSTLAELIYMWGDTPNPKMPADSTARYKVPTCVRSNPQQTTPGYDAGGFIEKLHEGGVPAGVVTILDLEEAIDPAWVLGYGELVHAAGYLVWPYGSTDFLFRNPPLDGYFVGNPTQIPHLWPGSRATQWGFFGAYDLSLIAAGADLWDTEPHIITPVPPSVTGPAYPLLGQEPLMIVPFSTTTGEDGTAYVPIVIPSGCTMLLGGWADVMSASAFTPPHHDGDITAADPAGLTVAPAVGAAPAVRIAGAVPNHFYTGRAVCG